VPMAARVACTRFRAAAPAYLGGAPPNSASRRLGELVDGGAHGSALGAR
jgi:hypothetical protein